MKGRAFRRRVCLLASSIDVRYVRVASSGRKHFPLLVGAPVAYFAATVRQHRSSTNASHRGFVRTENAHR